MRRTFLLFLGGLLIALGGCDFSKLIPKTSFKTSKSSVLKVYSISDAGHNFIAYVVDVGGKEVVVSDPLGRSSHKVGDTIEFMAQKIELSGGNKTLSYTLLK